MSVLIPGYLKAIKHPMVSVHISMHTSIEVKMYEELDSVERALQHFGTRVEVVTCLEMGGKITSEEAYQMIKSEVKELKQVRKSWKKEK